jgi:hypothetical protein
MPGIDADVYVLSYPKAGRTWLRTLIGKLLVDRYGYSDRRVLQAQALTRSRGLPEIGFDHDGSAMRIMMRWQDMPTDRSTYAGKRVVLLGRDTRDTLVSAYFQATRRIGVWNEPISPFLRSDYFGVDKVLTFYRIWADNQHVPEVFRFIRYEDMHRDAASVLQSLLPVLGIDVTPAAVAAAVEYCRFENLRAAEDEHRFRGFGFNTRGTGDPDGRKVRKGKVGNFGEYLSADDIAFVDDAVAARGCEFTPPCTVATPAAPQLPH